MGLIKMDIKTDFGKWNSKDLDDYVENKRQAEEKYNKTGKWDADLAARNQELRNKYGTTEDKYSYNDLGDYRVRVENVIKGGGGGGGGSSSKPVFNSNVQLGGADMDLVGGVISIVVMYLFLSIFRR